MTNEIDLSGKWTAIAMGDAYEVMLPGTSEENGIKGNMAIYTGTEYLSRNNGYEGKITYSREVLIPEKGQWTLSLERTKFARVFCDGKEIGTSHDTVVPQVYHFDIDSEGQHILTIEVDNCLTSYPDFPDALMGGHQFTDHTQTNWNGILGEITMYHGDLASSGSMIGRTKQYYAKGRYLYKDGVRVSLRGNVDCAIFPDYGHTPMDIDFWRRMFGLYREYGLNHCRFHSWCPPEAAFMAADEEGIILQVEMPGFGIGLYTKEDKEYDEVLYRYLEDQSEKIVRTYGHHPSFVIFAIGNEMKGNRKAYEQLICQLRKINPVILYTQGSNNFLEDPFCSKEDEIWISMRTGKDANIRASFSHNDLPLGHVQTKEKASTTVDYNKQCKLSNVPVIAHEVGQFQVCPDLRENFDPLFTSYALKKYRDDLKNKGLLKLERQFFMASGKLSALLYKEEIEALLRTKEMTGFQLLGINDFPGQGTALVGVLDSHYKNKGIISASEWKNFCAPTVVMAKMKSFVYTTNESIEITPLLYHYGEKSIHDKVMIYVSGDSCDTLILNTDVQEFTPGALYTLPPVQIGTIALPGKYHLELQIGRVHNSYDLYVYKDDSVSEIKEKYSDIRIVTKLTKADKDYITKGGKVLFIGNQSDSGTEGFFPTDFWCYPMFKKACEDSKKPVAPGTMGLLIDDKHPIFQHFPTEYYAGWQWKGIVDNSAADCIESKDCKVIARVIDNFSRNESLAMIYEEKIGKGTLLTCTSKVIKPSKDPSLKALLEAMLEYLQSL